MIVNLVRRREQSAAGVFIFPIGNLKTYADLEYEWEAGRQLVKQTQNEKVVAYDYDYNGMRIRQTVSNKTSGYALLHQLLVIWKLKESHTVGIEKRHGR